MPDADTKQSIPAIAGIEEALRVISDQLGRIRFGSIALTINDGKIVQLDITEKKRLG